ncbi:MAG: hypothetical protein WBB95_21945, partial [Pseudomonas sp.]|uniref:hypothetical protein n=1 Tax=Pseudomonas sp. TaxID=306 RepID=UPI003C7940D3
MSTPPDDFDELDDPAFPAFGFVDLSSKKYPESAVIGLGRPSLIPWSFWGVSSWRNKNLLDTYFLRFDDITRPRASGTVTEDLPLYHLAFRGDDNIDKVVKFFTRVVRFSGQESRSKTSECLVLTTIPAGEDPNENEPWHSGLFGRLKDIPEGGVITQSTLKNEVLWEVSPYLNIRKNDENIIEVDGVSFIHIVSPEQASSKKPYSVPIPLDIFDKITKNGLIGVRMKVRNVMGYETEGRYKYSKAFSVYSELDFGRLSQLVLTKDVEEVFEIDLDFESESNYAGQLYPDRLPKPFPSPRHTLELYADVTPDNGSTETLLVGVIPDKNQGFESIPIPKNFFNDKVGPGKVRFYYRTVSANGTVVNESYSNLIYITGQQKWMPKLALKPFTGGLIPPNKDVEAAFPKYRPFNAKSIVTIIARTKGNNNGAYVYTSKQLAMIEESKRLLPSNSLKMFEGKGDLDVLYQVDQGNQKPPRTSEIEIARIGEGEAEMPALYIDLLKENYSNYNLNPSELTGYGLISKIPYSGTVFGDQVQMSLEGGSPKTSFKYNFDIDSSTEGLKLFDVELPMPEDIVRANKDNIVTARYSVISKGAPPVIRHSEVLIFSIGAPVELKTVKLREADTDQATVNPLAVSKGGTLEAEILEVRKDDMVYFDLQGEWAVAQHTDAVKVDPKSTVFKSAVPVDFFSRALRATGNNLLLKCWLKRGPFKYEFEPQQLRLAPSDLPAIYIEGFKGVPTLPVYQLKEINVIFPGWLFARVGQFFWAEVTYTSLDDALIIVNLATALEINASHVSAGIVIQFPLATAIKIKDCTALKITARVSFPGIASEQTATPFPEASYVAQQLPPVLDPPIFKSAAATPAVTINPVANQNNVVVVANVKGMLANDVVTMTCIIEGASPFMMTAKGQASGTLEFDFSSQRIIHNAVGRSMRFSYTLLRNGKTTPSNVLTVTVSSIPYTSNPQATINNQGSGTTLDLNLISGSTFYSMGRPLLLKEGQTL